MLCDKDKVADELIDWHFRVEPGTIAVYRIISPNEASPDEPIKLLEVNEETPETGRVDAFVFGPTSDIPCSTVIAMVTDKEMQLIEEGKIVLPEGWDLSRSRKYSRQSEQRALQ